MPGTKDDGPHVETIEGSATKVTTQEYQTYGTVQLLQGGSVVLIPTPSPDPKGKVTEFLILPKDPRRLEGAGSEAGHA